MLTAVLDDTPGEIQVDVELVEVLLAQHGRCQRAELRSSPARCSFQTAATVCVP